MNRRERLTATLRGDPVDRPAVSFYGLNGIDQDASDPDPFNIYADPSWKHLLRLATEKSDRIVSRYVGFVGGSPDPLAERTSEETFFDNGERVTVRRIRVGNRVLTSRYRRNPEVNTVWMEEHLLKGVDDLDAFLTIPPPVADGVPDTRPVTETEELLGDSGIVMIDTADPLCLAASLFSMADYTVIALTERTRFRRLLDRFASYLQPRTEAVAAALPGRLWRIYGPEYASPPYLPPSLFREYVCEYVRPMVSAIQRCGGYARIHSHGNLAAILDDIAALGADGLDPIEPPPQGDVELGYVRDRYGRDLVLFGNLEASDIQTLPPDRFAEKVRRALDEGTRGEGRGFVLTPSSAPYGRRLSPFTLRNHELMIELAESW